MKEVGGLDELKNWLTKRGKAFTPRARDFGLPEPRGILLLEKVSALTQGFSVSEIEEVIISGLYDAFNQDEELKQEHLESVIGSMIPLSQTMEEQIRGIRDWAKLRARRASTIRWEDESGAVRKLEMK
jgi:hypothetical protein